MSHPSREVLLTHPAVRRFVAWIGGKPKGFKPSGRVSQRCKV
jgi:hypothetical protein